MFKKKNVFEKINSYFKKKGHELILSIFLDNYNNNEIYIRFDYVPKLDIYKISWVDLHFFNEKAMAEYINTQIVTGFIAGKIIEEINKNQYDSMTFTNKDILGDRVEFIIYSPTEKEYVFDRVLPEELSKLSNIFILIFSYMPRSMDIILSEIFSRLDGLEEVYNHLKPVRFDLLKDDLKKYFREPSILRGLEYFKTGNVTYLERIDNKYFAIVSGRTNYLVILEEQDNNFVHMYCTCNCDHFCKHEAAVIFAIRKNIEHKFFKVKYLGDDKTLFERVMDNNYSLCYGYKDDKILIVSPDGKLIEYPIKKGNEVLFSVLEDDDSLSLSEYIDKFKEE